MMMTVRKHDEKARERFISHNGVSGVSALHYNGGGAQQPLEYVS